MNSVIVKLVNDVLVFCIVLIIAFCNNRVSFFYL